MSNKSKGNNKPTFPLKLPDSLELPESKRGSTFGDMNLNDYVTQAGGQKSDCENEGDNPPEQPPLNLTAPKPKVNLQHPDHLRFLSVGVLALSLLYIYLAFDNDFQTEYYTQEISAIFVFGGLPIGVIGYIWAFFLPLPTTKSVVEKPVDPSLCPITNKVIKDEAGKKIPFQFTRIKYPSTPQKDCRYSFCDALSQQIYSIQRTGTLEELRQTAFELPPEKRTVLIDKIFDEHTVSISIHVETVLHNSRSEFSFTVKRGLRLMQELDREALRAVFHLYNHKKIEDEKYKKFVTSLVADDKQGSIEDYKQNIATFVENIEDHMPVARLPTASSRAFWIIENNLLWRHEETQSQIFHLVDKLKIENPNDPIIREVFNKMHQGGKWLSYSDLPCKNFNLSKNNEYILNLGEFDNGKPLYFTGDGSLMTIGSPGTGKTQSLVIPNLLNWSGSAIVIDIKPELWDLTAGYRAKEFGPVYKLNLTQNGKPTDHFNPFEYISDDPEELFADAGFIAGLVVPLFAKGGSTEFWEGGARNILQACIIGLVMEREDELKKHESLRSEYTQDLSLRSLMDVLADMGSIMHLVSIMNSSSNYECSLLAKRITSRLINPAEKTSNVLSTILQQLDIKMQELSNPKLMKMTTHSDWHPSELRKNNGTLYILVETEGVEQYATFLRLVLGVHMREYQRVSEEVAKQLPPILLMFDEMPQLGYMKAIEQAIATGRSKGIKLWGFCQSLGQLEEHYQKGRSLLAKCKVRTYLSPSSEDNLAKLVSETLGNKADLATGQLRPLASPADLSGAAYRDKIIVTGQGSDPVKLEKKMAYEDPELRRKMSIPPPE